MSQLDKEGISQGCIRQSTPSMKNHSHAAKIRRCRMKSLPKMKRVAAGSGELEPAAGLLGVVMSRLYSDLGCWDFLRLVSEAGIYFAQGAK